MTNLVFPPAGPLVVVTVALGDTARLPCRHPQNPDDTLNLVLWYLNHTSRPFLRWVSFAPLLPGLNEVVDWSLKITSFQGESHRRGFVIFYRVVN